MSPDHEVLRPLPQQIANTILNFVLVSLGVAAGAGDSPSLDFAAYGIAMVVAVAGASKNDMARRIAQPAFHFSFWAVLVAVLHGLMHPTCNNRPFVVWITAGFSLVYTACATALFFQRQRQTFGGDMLGCMREASTDFRLMLRDHPLCFLLVCLALVLWFVVVDLAGSDRCERDRAAWTVLMVRGLREGNTVPSIPLLDTFTKSVVSPILRAIPQTDNDIMVGTLVLYIALVVVWAAMVRLCCIVDEEWVKFDRKIAVFDKKKKMADQNISDQFKKKSVRP